MPGAQRRALILEAARRVLRRDGVAAITMDRVAQEASVSKPLVYQHFANASELLVALLREELVRVEALIDGAGPDLDFEGRLRASARAYFEAFAQRDAVLLQLLGQAAAEPEVQRITREHRLEGIRYWTRRARAELGIPAAKAEPLAVMLLSAFDGLAAHWAASGGSIDAAVDTYTDAAMAVVRHVAGTGRRA